MKKSAAKNEVIEYVLEAERSNFHREWAPENLKGLSLKEAYQMGKNHIFMVAVIAVYGMREYKSSVKTRWEEVNKRMIR